jgi:ubiquinone/menaquinone biosynthesis C-methylase UbiE
VSRSADHFDRLAPRYRELRASHAFVDPVTAVVVELADLRGKRVLDVGCVHHLDRPRTFDEIRRVLRRGGWLAITTTDPAVLATRP